MIEQGCKARIINSAAGNDGIIVTVGAFIGEVKGYYYNNHWEINKEIKDTAGLFSKHIDESQLQRISDDDEELGSWEALSNIWNPSGVIA